MALIENIIANLLPNRGALGQFRPSAGMPSPQEQNALNQLIANSQRRALTGSSAPVGDLSESLSQSRDLFNFVNGQEPRPATEVPQTTAPVGGAAGIPSTGIGTQVLSSSPAAQAAGSGAGSAVQPFVGPALLAGATFQFGRDVRSSRQKRKILEARSKLRVASDKAFRNTSDSLSNNLTKGLGVDQKTAVSQIAADAFNKIQGPKSRADAQSLKTFGFDANDEALQSLIFDGEYTFGKSRRTRNFPATGTTSRFTEPDLAQTFSMTLDQFLDSAPPEVVNRIENFINSDAYVTARNDFKNLQEIRGLVDDRLVDNKDVYAVPDIVHELRKPLSERYGFGNG